MRSGFGGTSMSKMLLYQHMSELEIEPLATTEDMSGVEALAELLTALIGPKTEMPVIRF